MLENTEVLTPNEIWKRKVIPGMGRNQVYNFIRDRVPHTKYGKSMFTTVEAVRLAVLIPDIKEQVDIASKALSSNPVDIIKKLIVPSPDRLLSVATKPDEGDE